jgi:hypothetical protein
VLRAPVAPRSSAAITVIAPEGGVTRPASARGRCGQSLAVEEVGDRKPVAERAASPPAANAPARAAHQTQRLRAAQRRHGRDQHRWRVVSVSGPAGADRVATSSRRRAGEHDHMDDRHVSVDRVLKGAPKIVKVVFANGQDVMGTARRSSRWGSARC